MPTNPVHITREHGETFPVTVREGHRSASSPMLFLGKSGTMDGHGFYEMVERLARYSGAGEP
jgi:hypothetical protein